MKQVLKSLGRWALYSFIAYAIILAIIISYYGIVGAMIDSNPSKALDFSNEEIKETVIGCDDIINNTLEITEDMTTEQVAENEFLAEHVAGYIYYLSTISQSLTLSEICGTSLAIGAFIGCVIFLFSLKSARVQKTFIAGYILAIIILGFVEGFTTISGSDLTFLDYWTMPESYIIPVTIVFAIVLIIVYIRQNKVAKQLNEKLKELKK